MTGFEPRISGVESNRSSNCTTTTALWVLLFHQTKNIRENDAKTDQIKNGLSDPPRFCSLIVSPQDIGQTDSLPNDISPIYFRPQ